MYKGKVFEPPLVKSGLEINSGHMLLFVLLGKMSHGFIGNFLM